MNDLCEWKKLIRVLLPFFVALVSNGTGLVASTVPMPTNTTDMPTTNNATNFTVEPESTTWGNATEDEYWADAVTNLTHLEKRSAFLNLEEKPPSASDSSSSFFGNIIHTATKILTPGDKSESRSKSGRSPSVNTNSMYEPAYVLKYKNDVYADTLEEDFDEDNFDEEYTTVVYNDSEEILVPKFVKIPLNPNPIRPATTSRPNSKLIKTKFPTAKPMRPKSRAKNKNRFNKLRRPNRNKNRRKKPTKRPSNFGMETSTIVADLSPFGQDYYLEYENSSSDHKPVNNSSNNTISVITTLKPNLPKNQKNKKRRRKRPPGGTRRPQTPTERSTIVADLSPFGQDYYLEYESNEDELKNQTSKNSTDTKIQFYPKRPVNLLYVLQAMAENVEPIKVQSPITGQTSSVPVRIPVRVNRPSANPFIFTMDLGNVFTRLAISFFYSSIAIAPMVYLLIGGLGSLGGFSMVPLATGKKRRKRRRRQLELASETVFSDELALMKGIWDDLKELFSSGSFELFSDDPAKERDE